MKTSILVLAALVSTVQTVGWVDCCCILICKHHNDPCKDECKDKEKAATGNHDCCEKPAPKAPVPEDGKRCSHVEPSSEVAAQAADLHPAAAQLIAEPPFVDLLPIPAAAPRSEPRSDVSRGSPPLLHLLFGTLLI